MLSCFGWFFHTFLDLRFFGRHGALSLLSSLVRNCCNIAGNLSAVLGTAAPATPKSGVWICHGLACAKDRRALHSFPLWQQLYEFYVYEPRQAFRSGFVCLNMFKLFFSLVFPLLWSIWDELDCVCGCFLSDLVICFILERLDWNGWCSFFCLLLNETVPASSPLSHVFMCFVFPFVCSSSFFYRFACFCFISSAFPFCNFPCWLLNPSNPSIFTFISP